MRRVCVTSRGTNERKTPVCYHHRRHIDRLITKLISRKKRRSDLVSISASGPPQPVARGTAILSAPVLLARAGAVLRLSISPSFIRLIRTRLMVPVAVKVAPCCSSSSIATCELIRSGIRSRLLHGRAGGGVARWYLVLLLLLLLLLRSTGCLRCKVWCSKLCARSVGRRSWDRFLPRLHGLLGVGEGATCHLTSRWLRHRLSRELRPVWGVHRLCRELLPRRLHPLLRVCPQCVVIPAVIIAARLTHDGQWGGR